MLSMLEPVKSTVLGNIVMKILRDMHSFMFYAEKES